MARIDDRREKAIERATRSDDRVEEEVTSAVSDGPDPQPDTDSAAATEDAESPGAGIVRDEEPAEPNEPG